TSCDARAQQLHLQNYLTAELPGRNATVNISRDTFAKFAMVVSAQCASMLWGACVQFHPSQSLEAPVVVAHWLQCAVASRMQFPASAKHDVVPAVLSVPLL